MYGHQNQHFMLTTKENQYNQSDQCQKWKSVADTLNGYNQRLNHKHIKDFP